MDRPYVLLSCAMSIDGYLDDASDQRLVLSGAADLDRVDALRAGSDAILVGAGTIRADNPRLLLRSSSRRAARAAAGLSPDPLRVVLSSSGDLDSGLRVFASGEARPLVYVSPEVFSGRVGGLTEVADVAEGGGLAVVLADLARHRIGRLMVEGGTSVLTQFLAGGLADELQITIAPFFVGDSRAPRLVSDGEFPFSAGHPARLVQIDRVEETALMVYALSDQYPGPTARGPA